MATYIGAWVELYRMAKNAIQLCEVTCIRFLLRIGIKVVDEWQISFGLRAWTINLRTWIFGFTYLVFKSTCIDAEKPLREGAFSSRE